MNLATRRVKLRRVQTRLSHVPVIYSPPPGTRVITDISVTIPSHGAGAVEDGEDIIVVTTEGEAGEDTGLVIMEAMGMGEDITMGTEGGSNDVMIVSVCQ